MTFEHELFIENDLSEITNSFRPFLEITFFLFNEKLVKMLGDYRQKKSDRQQRFHKSNWLVRWALELHVVLSNVAESCSPLKDLLAL
jgi:hypothetical protein